MAQKRPKLMKLGLKFPHKKLFKLAKVLHLLDSMDLDNHNGIFKTTDWKLLKSILSCTSKTLNENYTSAYNL